MNPKEYNEHDVASLLWEIFGDESVEASQLSGAFWEVEGERGENPYTGEKRVAVLSRIRVG